MGSVFSIAADLLESWESLIGLGALLVVAGAAVYLPIAGGIDLAKQRQRRKARNAAIDELLRDRQST